MKKSFSEPTVSVKVLDGFVCMSVEIEWNSEEWGDDWTPFDS